MKKVTATRVAALPEHARVQVEAIGDLIDKSEDVVALYESGIRAVLPDSTRNLRPDIPLTMYPLTPDPAEIELWDKEDQPRLSTSHGWHSALCSDSEAESGQPVGDPEAGDHGPWCESDSRGSVRGWNDDGQCVEMSASIVDRYRHGVYADYTKRIGRSDRFIAIRTGEYPGELVTYLNVGEALRLAAGINALAAAADDLDAPLPRRRKA